MNTTGPTLGKLLCAIWFGATPPIAVENVVTVWKSDRVATMVGEVWVRAEEYALAVTTKKDGNECQEEWTTYMKALDKALFDNSTYGDCAVVQLLDFLHEGGPGDDVIQCIRSRGRRMLPILEFALKKPIMRLSPLVSEHRLKCLENVMRDIKTGKKYRFPL